VKRAERERGKDPSGTSAEEIRIVATLLLHCCYTAVTLLLHCSYTVVTLLLYYCNTIVVIEEGTHGCGGSAPSRGMCI
jgi:hypothetical protein